MKTARVSIAIAALMAMGITACSTQPEAAPQEQVDEQPDTETQSPAQEQELALEEQINALKIEAGLSAEEYATVLFEERLVAWRLAGADEAFELLQYEVDAAKREEVQKQIAEEQKNIYANALFVPGWEENLSILADQRAQTNAILLIDWLKTKGRGGVLWEEGNVVERVDVLEEDAEAGTRKLYVAGYQTNNGAETTQADSPNAKADGAPWAFYVTTTTIDGTEYISDWSVEG